MLDCLAAHAHRLRVLIETLLHSFEHVLVFPSRDSPLGSCRTPGFERAARACRRPVAAQRLAILLVRITIGQLLARRAAIDILSWQINEILLAETASDFAPDVIGFGSVTVMSACSHARISGLLK
jgi:hypothetical protein